MGRKGYLGLLIYTLGTDLMRKKNPAYKNTGQHFYDELLIFGIPEIRAYNPIQV